MKRAGRRTGRRRRGRSRNSGSSEGELGASMNIHKSMKKNNIVIILAIAIVALLGYFLFMAKPSGTAMRPANTQLISGYTLPYSYTVHYRPLRSGTKEIIVYRKGERFREDIFGPAANFDQVRILVTNNHYSCNRPKNTQIGWECWKRPGSTLNYQKGLSNISEWVTIADAFGFTKTGIYEGEKILNLPTRCFTVEGVTAGPEGPITVKEEICLHPEYDLILKAWDKVASDLSFDPVQDAIFEPPGPIVGEFPN